MNRLYDKHGGLDGPDYRENQFEKLSDEKHESDDHPDLPDPKFFFREHVECIDPKSLDHFTGKIIDLRVVNGEYEYKIDTISLWFPEIAVKEVVLGRKFKPNPVTHPPHYNSGKIEVIEAIEDWGLNFCRGNTVKYVARAGKKDPAKEIEDLEKASWYLRREIEFLTAQKDGRSPIKPNHMEKK